VSAVADPQEKIFARAQLVRRFGSPRGDVVVFTNGCFDILHRGHVAYLCAARALGDRLVVGVNTDASVRRLKGAGRPVSAEADRAYVLAGLACVDAVTLFDEDTPLELIRALRPDVLVKGGDYTADAVVGRDIVEANGGRLVLIPLVVGQSTTSILDRIRECNG
jgi:D-beta-D-heptose 7-phosphate kinase/D-beta-D-heptose 1-phosphate adenosyltransferase